MVKAFFLVSRWNAAQEAFLVHWVLYAWNSVHFFEMYSGWNSGEEDSRSVAFRTGMSKEKKDRLVG